MSKKDDFAEVDAYYTHIQEVEATKVTPEQKEWYETQAFAHWGHPTKTGWFTPWPKWSRWKRFKRWLMFRLRMVR